MSLIFLPVYILMISFTLLITIVCYKLWLHPLSNVPGPKLAAASNIWLARHVQNGTVFQLGKALHKRYGPAVRVGPNEVWFDSKPAFRAIYGEILNLGIFVLLAINRRAWQVLVTDTRNQTFIVRLLCYWMAFL